MHAGATRLFPENLKGNASGAKPLQFLKDFGRYDCFLQLHIWSAGPHSFLANINIQNVSKGRALH